MANETRLFKSKERMGRAQAADFLRQIADKIDVGQVILRQGSEEFTLNLSDNVILEIQAEDEDKGAKGIQHSLELEIKWYDSDADRGGPVELGKKTVLCFLRSFVIKNISDTKSHALNN